MDNEQKKWMKVIYITCALLLIVIGFTLGYIYNYKANNSCTNNPFTYGVKEMNKLNDAYFLCTCNGGEGLSFNFDEDEMNSGSYFDDNRLGEE